MKNQKQNNAKQNLIGSINSPNNKHNPNKITFSIAASSIRFRVSPETASLVREILSRQTGQTLQNKLYIVSFL